MNFNIILLVAFNIWINYVDAKISPNKLHSLLLDNEKIKMNWVIDWSRKEVLFNIQNVFTKNYNWFYFGFSSRGNFERSDLCLFQIDNLFITEQDLYTSENGKYLMVDEQQDCELIRQDGNSIAFKRKFDTCDNDDLQMHEGTMYILWGRGSEILDFENHNSIPVPEIPKKDHGVRFLQLLRADLITIPEKEFENFVIKLENVMMPSKDTTYWCKIQKLDEAFQHKHHIVQFAPIVDKTKYVHHMEIFHCDTDANIEIPLYNGDCDTMPAEAKVCSKVISLWAMGATAFTYPPEAGLPIGGHDYNPYIRLEVHYNNPDMDSGVIDSSGIKIRTVRKLRKYDAGIIELGLEYTDKMAIPPGQQGFPLSGYCIAECTKTAIPEKGIVVFGSQLHTHLRGTRVITRHVRGETELPELNRDDFYSHHFQEIRQLRRKPVVLPGDALVTTCYYNTIGYVNATLGGFSIKDEMCVNYIQYYPATELELCKSAVSENTLDEFFIYENKNTDDARSENYKTLEWDQRLVSQLYTMYIDEPLSMQCNRSDGNRFPGFNWEDAPITMLPILPPTNQRACTTRASYRPPLEQGNCDLIGECIY